MIFEGIFESIPRRISEGTSNKCLLYFLEEWMEILEEFFEEIPEEVQEEF